VEQGIHAFVLQYRVAPHRHPEPLMDASRAIRLVRRHAAEWNILPDHVAILGFSAGGHLTASAGTLWEKYDFRGVDDLAPVSNRPDAFAPCYPVISTGPHAHRGSFENLTGAYPPPGGLKEELSLELQVTPRTPPCFLWHTADDDAVPVENSLLFAQACRRQGVPFELVVYPKGHHGLGLAEDNPHVASWSGLCCDWLKQMGW
jgi:acetyl esterase/lipase